MAMNTIYTFIKKNNIISAGTTIIVGLSGGPDSVFLLHVLNSLKKEYSLSLIAAYLDHEWRSDTQDDVSLCTNLCKELLIPFVTARAQDLPIKAPDHGSLEAQGRTWRRFYFEHLASLYNAHAIALGHHQDDQLETFFIRLARGSSLSGLCCMKPRHGLYIRPLLETSKKDIIQYLETNGISYKTDSSNNSDCFLRNRIRHIGLPSLEKCDQRFVPNTLRAIKHLQSAHEALSATIHEKMNNCIKATAHAVNTIDLLSLKKEALFIQKEIVIQWIIQHNLPCILTEAITEEIMRFLTSPRGGTHMITDHWHITKKRNLAFINAS